MRLADEAEGAVRELRDLQRGRVMIGANEAAVHVLLPLIGALPDAGTRASRWTCGACPSRQVAAAVLERSLDFGVISFPAGGAGPRAASPSAPTNW